MADTAGTAKSDKDNTGWGCALLMAIVAFGPLGDLLFRVWSVDMAGTLFVCAAIVACVAMVCLTHYRVTKLRLEDARNQRLLEENRQTEIRQHELELARMDFELVLAKLKVEQSSTRALPPAQKRVSVGRFR